MKLKHFYFFFCFHADRQFGRLCIHCRSTKAPTQTKINSHSAPPSFGVCFDDDNRSA